jgi:uncharacterized FlaG/YvyC family protein
MNINPVNSTQYSIEVQTQRQKQDSVKTIEQDKNLAQSNIEVKPQNSISKIPDDVLKIINDKTKTSMLFDFDENKRPIVKFQDKETKEIVYQVPSEQLIKQSQRFKEYLDRVQVDILDSPVNLPKGTFINFKA